MPTYEYLCSSCGKEFQQWQSIKDDALTAHSCGGSLRRVYNQVRTNGIGTHGQHYLETEAKEKRWVKDMKSYKNLVRDGTQPRRIDGCDRLEATAVGKWHIETGQAHPDHKVWEGIETAKSIMRDSPLDSITTLKRKK